VPVNTSKRWTPEEDERLKSLMESDVSLILIAAKLKRTVEGVKTRVGKLKLRRRPAPQSNIATPKRWTDEEDGRLLELKRTATPVAVIAKELKRTESAVTLRLVVLKRRGLSS
jgi:hypothetical protein